MEYRNQKVLIVALMFVSLFGFAYRSKADTCDVTQGYCMLAPLPFDGAGSTQNQLPYGNDLSLYVNGMVKLIIGLAGVLAVVAIMIGGFQYVTAATVNGKSNGRDTIFNALIGLGLAMASYLILYSLNPNLLNFNLSTLSPLSAEEQGSSAGNTGQNGGVTDPGAGQKNQGTTTQIPDTKGIIPAQGLTNTVWADDSTDRGKFNIDIGFNAANCDFVGRTNCTSLAGISDTVVNDLNAVDNLCGCSITITGGTEYWNHDGHSNDISVNTSPHKPGGSVLDLRYDSGTSGTLRAFLMKNGTPTTQSGCTEGTERYLYNGSLYVNEVGLPQETGAHWHVCFQ